MDADAQVHADADPDVKANADPDVNVDADPDEKPVSELMQKSAAIADVSRLLQIWDYALLM